jgi:hypothetical protein
MQADRLLKLAEYLRTVDKRKFDLDTWGEVVRDKETGELKCGTTACAVGHACFNPDFRDEGLGISAFYLKDGGIVPTFNGYYGPYAVSIFFDIDAIQTNHLFYADSYKYGRRGPRSVANRIESFVRRGGMPKQRKERVSV